MTEPPDTELPEPDDRQPDRRPSAHPTAGLPTVTVLVEQELSIEDVPVDGMCSVY
jgi:hypothetical protein